MNELLSGQRSKYYFLCSESAPFSNQEKLSSFLRNQKITEKLKFQRTFLSNMHFPRKKANNQLWKMFVFPPRGFGNLSTQFVCPGLSWEYEYTLYIIHTTKHNPEHLLILVKGQSLRFGESHDEKILAVSVNGH